MKGLDTGVVLAFEARSNIRQRTGVETKVGQSAEIVIFPGIRYERHVNRLDEANAAVQEQPKATRRRKSHRSRDRIELSGDC